MSNLDFTELDVPELCINIWSYNSNQEHLQKCKICKSYNDLSTHALKKKWRRSWGDCEYFINKLVTNDKFYININKYASANKHEIIDFIKRYNVKN